MFFLHFYHSPFIYMILAYIKIDIWFSYQILIASHFPKFLPVKFRFVRSVSVDLPIEVQQPKKFKFWKFVHIYSNMNWWELTILAYNIGESRALSMNYLICVACLCYMCDS